VADCLKQVVCDIEANSLNKPTKIWLVVCKDVDTGKLDIFRNLTENEEDRIRFLEYAKEASLWIGHNWLGYDWPVLRDLIGLTIDDVVDASFDTLVVSKLLDYSKAGHSIEAYGEEFGLEKIKFSDWTKWSPEMEEYCIRDVQINEKIFNKFKHILKDPNWAMSLRDEQNFQECGVNALHNNGFYFNTGAADRLLVKVVADLGKLDEEIHSAFPRKLKPVREIVPRLTQHGTLHKQDFRWVPGGDLSEFNGGPFTRCQWHEFNPASHKQIVDILGQAGWSPVDKTQTHIDTEREINRLKYRKGHGNSIDIRLQDLYTKLEQLKKTGWKVNENNLATLPSSAPKPARLLAKRILLEARRRTLVEWLGLVQPDGRIHGKFYGIGAWTHRMAHQSPNTANIPREFREDGSPKLLGREMRQLWCAPRRRLLVGVDAEGIQLRIFAHYIDDAEFTKALVAGKKDEKTDPHSLNQRILGSICKSRSAAKRFIYALLLGAGIGKLAQILECSVSEAQEALSRLLRRYRGFAFVKEQIIPSDAERGYFVGLDGRKVSLPGSTKSERAHLCMSGYLQNGEAIIMKKACLKWISRLKDYDAILVNFVHDEWQTECPNDMQIAVKIAKMQADSIRIVGEELGLKCPLAGSYWNEDHKDYTIGTNWYQTH
jgi:DNA polymerase-1